MKIKCVLSTSRIPPNMESIRIHCNTKQPNGSKDGIHQALWGWGFVLKEERSVPEFLSWKVGKSQQIIICSIEKGRFVAKVLKYDN